MFQFSSEQFRLKVGLAEMLKGGVIMDVTNAEQAKIAEEAGASRGDGAGARAVGHPQGGRRGAHGATSRSCEEIMKTVTIPVMAKARIGHFMEARVLEALGVDYIDESEVLTPADEEHHIDKNDFKVPFVCGARNLGEALRRIGEGAAMIRTKGEAGTGNIVEAVRHMRTIVKEMKQLTVLGKEELVTEAKNLQAPLELVEWVAEHGKLPVPNFSAGGIATPADAALVMQLGAEAVFVGSGIFKSSDPASARQRHREGRHELQQSGEAAGSQPEPGRGDAGPGDLEDSGRRAAADPRLVMKKVGVLSLQGDFAAHGAALERAGAVPVYVRERSQLDEIDGLIIPGGESTTMLKLLHYENLFDDAGRVRPAQADVRHLRRRDSDGQGRHQSGAGKPGSDGYRGGAQRLRPAGRQPRRGTRCRSRNLRQRTAPGKLEAVFIRAPIIRRRRERDPGAGGVRGRSGADRAGAAPGGDLPSGTDQGRPGPQPVSGEAVTPASKKRVLFVCIGNACRSQMAEGFARDVRQRRDDCGQRGPGAGDGGGSGHHPRDGREEYRSARSFSEESAAVWGGRISIWWSI